MFWSEKKYILELLTLKNTMSIHIPEVVPGVPEVRPGCPRSGAPDTIFYSYNYRR